MSSPHHINGYVLATPRELRLVRLVKDGWVLTKCVPLQAPATTPDKILQNLGVRAASVDSITDSEAEELVTRLPDLFADAETRIWSYRGPRPNAKIAAEVLTSLLRARTTVWVDEATGKYAYKAMGCAFRFPSYAT